MQALPVSGLEPQSLATIRGLIEAPRDQSWQESIELLEPPAGRRVPYIDPAKALEKLLRRQGISTDDAQARACEAVLQMKKDISKCHWVNFFDNLNPESPECLPVPDFVAWLRDESRRRIHLPGDLSLDAQVCWKSAWEPLLVPSDITDFFEQAADAATSSSMFRGRDNWNEPWSLETLPTSSPPNAMIEFVPRAPWVNIDDQVDRSAHDSAFLRWRESMRPIALELQRVLGESVYHFAHPNDDTDDDCVHRFLVLHWCCTWKPESAFVRYLLKVTAASDVDELKMALIDPAAYLQPFKMNDASVALETLPFHIDYILPQARKTVAVAFLTPQARDVARSVISQKIGAHLHILAPKELATDDWIRQATRHCRGWSIRYIYECKLNDPIEILAMTDELCVIADEHVPLPGFDLKLCDSLEDLLWLGLTSNIEAAYFHIEGTQLMNPDVCLQKRGVPERVAARQAERAAFTRQLKEVRLEDDFGSSGLWDAKGRNLGFDLLDLPFALARRLAAWQRDHDETMSPPQMGDNAWWQHHEQQALAIARDLQASLGKSISVKLHDRDAWLTVDEVDRSNDSR